MTARATANLTDAHSSYAPAGGMMPAAQQIAHAAHPIDWFAMRARIDQGFAATHAKLAASSVLPVPW